MNRRRKHSSPFRILILIALVGVAFYINQVIVPVTPPLFVSTPTPTRSPDSFVLEAQKLTGEGKLLPSIAAYKAAVQADPTNPSNFVALARLQVYAGQYKEAKTSAENALLLSPNLSMAHAVRGWALSFLGDYLPAEAAFKRAIELDPNNAVAYSYHAEMLAQMVANNKGDIGTLDKAVAESRTAQKINPNLLETHRARGIVLEITGNYAEAATEFEAAIGVDPNIGDLHLALGRNYRQLEDYARAIEQFQIANTLNPKDPLPNTYIARTYATIGEYSKAIQYADAAVKITPEDPYMWGNLGTMYYRNKQYEDALLPMELAVRGGKSPEGTQVTGLPLDPGNSRVVEYYYMYGLGLARLGKCGDAIQVSQAMLQAIKPNDSDPTIQVAIDNANAMVEICQEIVSGTATPQTVSTGEPVDGTAGPGSSPTGENTTPEPSATP